MSPNDSRHSAETIGVQTRASNSDRPQPLIPQLRAYARTLTTRAPSEDLSRFVVFARGRSGSTLLADLLNCLPGVFCDREILNRPVLRPRLWIESQRRVHPGLHYGFKVKIYQLTDAQHMREPGRLIRDLHGDGWKVIYLYRRDLVRQIVSSFILARDTSANTHYTVQQTPERRPIHVKPAVALAGIKARADLQAQELRILEGLDRLEIVYEDDLIDPPHQQATLDRVAAHIGVATATATTQRQRINIGRLSELVENYDELADILVGTPWELLPGT